LSAKKSDGIGTRRQTTQERGVHKMKTISKYQIYTGEEFETEKDALRKLEKKYGDVLFKIAHKLVAYADGNYFRTSEWIDKNLHEFLTLKTIKEDMILIETE
jgi:hypothetical protein